MGFNDWKSKTKEHIGVLLLFTVLTLILTYPVITRVVTHAAGDGGDGFQFKWNIWHVNRVLTEGGGISEIHHTDYQYYPAGTSLAFSTLSLTNTLFLAFPLTLITDNLVLIYNILFLFNFIMAGYAMYLLIKYLIKNRIIAFLAGFAYAFSPLHMAWGWGFINLMSFCWTPLFFLFFFKIFEEIKIKNAIAAAIFLFFMTLASWYHLLFAFLIALPYFIYKLITVRLFFTRHFFIRIALFLILFGIIMSPFIIPVVSEYLRPERDHYSRPLYKTITPLNYILPSAFHPLWGESVKKLYPVFGGWPLLDMIVFPGYLVLLLSLFYLATIRKHFFWFFTALFFFGLSLIPHYETLAFFINSLFAFDVIRVPARFSFGVLFSLIIIFSFALRNFLPTWEEKIKEKFALSGSRARTILGSALFFILVLEYLAVPYPTTYGHRKLEMASAGEIGKTLRDPHPVFADDFIILTLPPTFFLYADQFNLYLQTFHQKKITGGYVGLKSPESGQYLNELREIIYQKNADKFQEFIENHRVGYVIFYGGRAEKAGRTNMEKNTIYLFGEISARFVAWHRKIYDIYVFQVFPEQVSEK